MRLLGILLAGSATLACQAEAPGLEVARWELSVPDRATTSISLPAHLDLPDEELTYQLETVVELPPELRSRRLDLIIPHLPAAPVDLEIDGRQAVRTSQELVDGYRATAPHVFRIGNVNAEKIRLRLRVAHRWTHSAWIDVVPVIRPTDDPGRLASAIKIVNVISGWIALVGLLQVGLGYLVIYLLDLRRHHLRWVILQLIAASTYSAYTIGLTQAIFWRYDLAVCAAALTVAVFASIQLSHFRLELPKTPRPIAYLFGVAALCPLLLARPFTSATVIARVTIPIVAFGILYQVFITSRALLRAPRRPRALLLALSWVVFLLTCGTDLIAWLGFGEPLAGVHLAAIGLATFSLLQALLASTDHLAAMALSDRLNEELQAQVAQLEHKQAEVAQLNTELRRQVAERSGRLVTALAISSDRALRPRRLQVGEVVDDRYVVLRPIASGGMGTVYEVSRTTDGRSLALKVADGDDVTNLARLAREAQLAAQVSHENVVSILDVNVAAAGFVYLIMELVNGPSLREALPHHEGELDWALFVLSQLAAGLTALHDSDILHRDLKPSNVLLAGDPSAPLVKLSDFGISRRYVHSEASGTDLIVADMDDSRQMVTVDLSTTSPTISTPSLTRTGTVMGTPRYMAPELTDPKVIDAAACDMFSFGIVAFELLAGCRPFVMPPRAHQTSDLPPSVGELVPTLPREVIEVVDACLLMDPKLRPTAKELKEKLMVRSPSPLTGGVEFVRALAHASLRP